MGAFDVQVVGGMDGVVTAVPAWDHALGRPNQEHPGQGALANHRTAGLAVMAHPILTGRNARCSLERAPHGVEVMTGCLASGETGQFVTLQTGCTRPAALGLDEAAALLV